MSSTSAVPPPNGTVANFTNPETTHRVLGMVMSGVGMAFMSTIMLLRIYTKTVMVHIFGIDDIFAVLAWVISLVTQSLYIYLWASKYLGTHIWDLAVMDINTCNKVITACSVTAVLTTSLAKTALLLSYRKLWLVEWFKTITLIVLVFIFSYSTALVLSLIFACVPIQKNWDITITTGHCLDLSALYISSAAFSATTDVVVFILPMPMVCGLRLRPFQKAGMVLMFGVASLTLIISIVFLSLFIPVIQKRGVDNTWDLSKIVAIVTVEQNLVLICGCFPALKLWARRTAPRFLGSEREDAVEVGNYVPPSSWESELSTFTNEISDKCAGKVGERGSRGAKGLDFGNVSMVRDNVAKAGLQQGVVLGQVIPDP